MRPKHETEHAEDWREPFPTPSEEDADDSELDQIDPDDPRWDAFIPDDDERNPQPEYGDFWPTE
jgi:hypothetical protein